MFSLCPQFLVPDIRKVLDIRDLTGNLEIVKILVYRGVFTGIEITVGDWPKPMAIENCH